MENFKELWCHGGLVNRGQNLSSVSFLFSEDQALKIQERTWPTMNEGMWERCGKAGCTETHSELTGNSCIRSIFPWLKVGNSQILPHFEKDFLLHISAWFWSPTRCSIFFYSLSVFLQEWAFKGPLALFLVLHGMKRQWGILMPQDRPGACTLAEYGMFLWPQEKTMLF
jgi:hypothetical protein